LSEIAEALAVPQGTVASRLRRAREIFQEAIRK
jgi:DNA-directed RNA polymerase specialized sigma24 family protein